MTHIAIYCLGFVDLQAEARLEENEVDSHTPFENMGRCSTPRGF
jgi:hypothetical protein